ncbi:hypothetical protein [Alkaliphilus metalliredigens]|nr:hypothetical protein [Alkaliphilus metalliredigens]
MAKQLKLSQQKKIEKLKEKGQEYYTPDLISKIDAMKVLTKH